MNVQEKLTSLGKLRHFTTDWHAISQEVFLFFFWELFWSFELEMGTLITHMERHTTG